MSTKATSANNHRSSPANAALGAFLRALRSRITPGSVGISSIGQRRVPGLRREEVAQLAGVGLAWYTWLEQGRDVNVSSDVLERIYAALALSPAEREHLFALAHNRPPPNVGFDDGEISESSATLLGRMADAAYISNTRWDVLAWNDAAALLFPDLATEQGGQPNMIRFLFTSPTLRALHVDWETNARVSLEKFKMDFWRNKDERPFAGLVSELQAVSPQFRQWWTSPFVHPTRNGVKTFLSNGGKAVDYSYSVLTLSENQSQRLVVFMPLKEAEPKRGVSYAARPNDDGAAPKPIHPRRQTRGAGNSRSRARST
jgi:transcriptional regulator with XRE-family HTH domain